MGAQEAADGRIGKKGGGGPMGGAEESSVAGGRGTNTYPLLLPFLHEPGPKETILEGQVWVISIVWQLGPVKHGPHRHWPLEQTPRLPHWVLSVQAVVAAAR